MTDVRVWAAEMVDDLGEQEIVDVVANGAEGFREPKASWGAERAACRPGSRRRIARR